MCGWALLLFPKVKHTWISFPQSSQILLSYFVHCSLHLSIKMLMNFDCEPSNICLFPWKYLTRPSINTKYGFVFTKLSWEPIHDRHCFNRWKASTNLFQSVTLVRYWGLVNATRTINSILQTLAYASTEITPMWCNPHRIFRPIILASVSKITPS